MKEGKRNDQMKKRKPEKKTTKEGKTWLKIKWIAWKKMPNVTDLKASYCQNLIQQPSQNEVVFNVAIRP